MKIKGALIALLLGSILSAVALTPAAAKELVKVIIVGPGLNDEVEITDTEQFLFIEELLVAPFIDEKPMGLLDAFFEIRMGYGSAGEVFAYNVYHYYPAQGDVAGYFYYAAVIEGSSSAEDRWFPIAEDDDRELREFLVSLGATGPLVEGKSTQASPLPFAMVIGFLLVLVLASVVFISRRKSSSRADK